MSGSVDAVELPADPGGNDAGGEHKLLNQAEPDRQGPADRPRGRAPVRTPSGTGPQRTPGWQGLGSRGVPSAEQDLEFVGQEGLRGTFEAPSRLVGHHRSLPWDNLF